MQRSRSAPGRILVVDDESFIREAIELYFASEGYEVFVAANGEDALSLLAGTTVDLAILDIVMPGMSGIELLREIKKSHPDVEAVMASGNGTLETAIEAMRLGAYDYIAKPILNFEEDLLKVVKKAMERRRLLTTNRTLARRLQDANLELKNTNAQMRRRVAELEILGETGRVLCEISDVDSLFDLAEGTLLTQLGFSHSLVLLRDGDEWTTGRASGFESWPDQSVTLGDHHVPLSPDGDAAAVPVTAVQALTKALEPHGGAVVDSDGAMIVPLRAGGTLRGAMVVFHSGLEEDEISSRLETLQIFAGQLAPLLGLLRRDVRPDEVKEGEVKQ